MSMLQVVRAKLADDVLRREISVEFKISCKSMRMVYGRIFDPSSAAMPILNHPVLLYKGPFAVQFRSHLPQQWLFKMMGCYCRHGCSGNMTHTATLTDHPDPLIQGNVAVRARNLIDRLGRRDSCGGGIIEVSFVLGADSPDQFNSIDAAEGRLETDAEGRDDQPDNVCNN